jgi:hypothetical protein
MRYPDAPKTGRAMGIVEILPVLGRCGGNVGDDILATDDCHSCPRGQNSLSFSVKVDSAPQKHGNDERFGGRLNIAHPSVVAWAANAFDFPRVRIASAAFNFDFGWFARVV